MSWDQSGRWINIGILRPNYSLRLPLIDAPRTGRNCPPRHPVQMTGSKRSGIADRWIRITIALPFGKAVQSSSMLPGRRVSDHQLVPEAISATGNRLDVGKAFHVDNYSNDVFVQHMLRLAGVDMFRLCRMILLGRADPDREKPFARSRFPQLRADPANWISEG